MTKKKSTAYLLWFFGGLVGLHNLYINEKKKALIKMSSAITLLACVIINTVFTAIVFSIIGITVIVLWIIDLFRISEAINKLNFIPETVNKITENEQPPTNNIDEIKESNLEKSNPEENIIEGIPNTENEAPEIITEKKHSTAIEEIKKTGKNIGANLGATALSTALGPLRLITDPLLKATTGKNTQEAIGNKLGATIKPVEKKEKYPIQGKFEIMLRDKSGKIIGTTRESNGRLSICKFGGPVLGYYDPKQNVTRLANGQIYARYNALSELLHK